MKIVFLSNHYNHHQAYISKKLYELTDGQYRFIASKADMSDSRKKLGYLELKDEFVVTYNGMDENIKYVIDSADIAIIGSAPEAWIENRKKMGKLTFRYVERPLKKGNQLWKYPVRFLKWHKQNPRKANIYILCASAYAFSDYLKFGLFKGKAFKWGYFPECKRYQNLDSLLNGKLKNEILWCGRFLDWKHPDDVLMVAKMLKDSEKSFHINIIGTGDMQSRLEDLRDQYELSKYVTFVGPVEADKVRDYMEKASIYMFTSDRQEGWGAVLNEAMNSGCAVVASDAAGATPYLINDGENGIVYHSGDLKSLYQSVAELLDNVELQKTLSVRAYETIVNYWNSDTAAERFFQLSEHILKGDNPQEIFTFGPCSRA